MPYIPHTQTDIDEMLKAIGIDRIDDCFKEIPPALRSSEFDLPAGMNEMMMLKRMEQLSQKNQNGACYIGAGAYEHYIPALVWQLTSRGEFLTAYTPYQAEASQGNLQLIYEFQSMMANLMGMEVANASLYDGATAVAEAALMALRCNKKASRKILVAGTINPRYLDTLNAIVAQQDIEVETIIFDPIRGVIDTDELENEDFAALIIQQPNFLGQLEAVDDLCRYAKSKQALVIACVNPLAMAILKEPGAWGDEGADIVCGDGQPLGIPLASGGPYFGFLAAKMAYIRQMPGRIVGRTTDLDGKPGFSLTLQAREQHIRRSKATSNICTNQGLLVTAATLYMALMGASGLSHVANTSHQRARELEQAIQSIDGVSILYQTPYFHEFVIKTERNVTEVLKQMAKRGIHAGYELADDYPDLKNCFLVCATETKTEDDIAHYAKQLELSIQG